MGKGLVGPKTIHEDLFLGITVLEHLVAFFKYLVEEGSYNLDLGMILCEIS